MKTFTIAIEIDSEADLPELNARVNLLQTVTRTAVKCNPEEGFERVQFASDRIARFIAAAADMPRPIAQARAQVMAWEVAFA